MGWDGGREELSGQVDLEELQPIAVGVDVWASLTLADMIYVI